MCFSTPISFLKRTGCHTKSNSNVLYVCTYVCRARLSLCLSHFLCFCLVPGRDLVLSHGPARALSLCPALCLYLVLSPSPSLSLVHARHLDSPIFLPPHHGDDLQKQNCEWAEKNLPQITAVSKRIFSQTVLLLGTVWQSHLSYRDFLLARLADCNGNSRNMICVNSCKQIYLLFSKGTWLTFSQRLKTLKSTNVWT